MSNHCITWAVNRPCPTPTSKLVLFLLANYANQKNECFPSERHLAEKCGVTDRSVRRALTLLIQKGYISVSKRGGRTNLYKIHADTSVRLVRTSVSVNTKETKKGRSLNDIAG